MSEKAIKILTEAIDEAIIALRTVRRIRAIIESNNNEDDVMRYHKICEVIMYADSN